MSGLKLKWSGKRGSYYANVPDRTSASVSKESSTWVWCVNTGYGCLNLQVRGTTKNRVSAQIDAEAAYLRANGDFLLEHAQVWATLHDVELPKVGEQS